MRAFDTFKQSHFPKDLRLALVTALVRVNDLEDAELILDTYWGTENFDLSIYKDLPKALCGLLNFISEPLKTKLYSGKFSEEDVNISNNLLKINLDQKGVVQCQNFASLKRESDRIFSILGVYVGCSPITVKRLAHLFNLAHKKDVQTPEISRFEKEILL